MNKIKGTVGFVSLGCPKNQIDTEVMLHELLTAGYEITADDINADVIIINTCAFIESAKRESIDNILDIAWLKKHRNLKAIIVAGCMAQRYRDEIASEMPEVDGIIGTGSIHNIVEAVDAVLEGIVICKIKRVFVVVICELQRFSIPFNSSAVKEVEDTAQEITQAHMSLYSFLALVLFIEYTNRRPL